MARVIFDHVWKRFGDSVAVRDLTMEASDGEFAVLVGPSGSGKSTAMRMVAGLEEISDGRIAIGDVVVNDLSPKDRDVAMVFQSYALYPHMDVFGNMAYGLKLRKTPKSEIEEKVRHAAGMLGIEELLDRKPKELSGGQRQRVALGRAIVREPQVFLMDEPLSNLDAKLRVQTRAELIKLHRRLRTTTIYVTHDQVEAMTMGDRIAVLNFGELQQYDTPVNLYNKPANVFVAGFIGSPSMNFVDMQVESNHQKITLRASRFSITLDDRSADVLQRHNLSTVTVGIRPEHIVPSHINGHDEDESATLSVTVDVVELLGNELFVYLDAGEREQLVARMQATVELQQGETIDVSIIHDHLHFFDPETELAIR